MARNPPWSRDELIIALDIYAAHQGRLPSMDIVDGVSRTLRAIAGAAASNAADNFRNRNSVLMKLGNFQAIDPAFVASGRAGLSRGAHGDRAVWDEFWGDRARLAATARAIVAATDAVSAGLIDPVEDGVEAIEGRLLTRMHQYRERDARLRSKKIARVVSGGKAIACEACGFDIEERYGSRGHGYIEVHHVVPLYELSGSRTTTLDDLALVCANCHRMIHAARPWLTMAKLRELIEARRKA